MRDDLHMCGGGEYILRRARAALEPVRRISSMPGSIHDMRISRFLTPLLLTLPFLPAAAQERGHVAPVLGYEFGVPQSIDRALDVVNRLGSAGPGTAFNHSLHLGVSVDLPDVIATGFGAGMRLGITGSTGAFRSSPIRSAVGLPAGAPAILRELEVEARSLAAETELRVGIGLAGPWSIGLGGWGSYRFAADYVETERIAEEGRSFPDGSRERVIAGGDSLGSAPFRYGLVLSSRYAISLSSSLTLGPEIYSRIDIPSAGLGIRALSIGAGVSIGFGAGTKDAAATGDTPDVELPDTMPSGTAREDERPSLSVSIDLRAIGPDGSGGQVGSIAVEPERRQVMLRLPARLRLGPDLERGQHMPDRTGPGVRAILDSPSPGYDMLVDAALDILGARMRKDTGLGIMLEGPAPRLDSIRARLADRWGIGAGRIMAMRTLPGDTASGFILSPSAGGERLFAPIEDEWSTRRFHVPQLEVVPEITAASGVRRWAVMVQHGERVVARSSSDGLSSPQALSLDVPEGTADSVAPLVAMLVAEDSAGAMATARDTLPLRVDRGGIGRRGGVVTMLVLMGDAPAGAAGTTDTMIERLAASIVPGDRVVISGVGNIGAMRESDRIPGIADRLRVRLRARGVVPGALDVVAPDAAAAGGAVTIHVTRWER